MTERLNCVWHKQELEPKATGICYPCGVKMFEKMYKDDPIKGVLAINRFTNEYFTRLIVKK